MKRDEETGATAPTEDMKADAGGRTAAKGRTKRAGRTDVTAAAEGAAPSALALELRDDGVAVLTMDVPGESENLLKDAFAAEFTALLDRLEANPAVRAVVFISGKRDSFIAGADVKGIRAATSADQATALSRTGQQAMDRMAALKVPTVAAINGSCLGGGLELALACSSRICTDGRKTELALPEVQLGLLPAAGGTQRLPRLVGISTALDLMLTGRRIKPQRALRMGLVDDVVPASILRATAIERALKLASEPPRAEGPFVRLGETLRELTTTKGLQEALLEDNPLGRRVLFQQARKQLRGKTRGNYPAPERIIDAVEIGLDQGMEAGLEAESRFFGELVMSPEAKQLIHVFFSTVALKKDPGVDDSSVKPRPVRRVAMIGAGLMGAGIAYVTANQGGIPVRLKDRDDEGVARGLKTVKELFDGRVKRKSLPRSEADLRYHLVTGTTDYRGFQGVDVVIEAVFESLELKHQVIGEVEAATGPETIFASNTSSIPISRLAAASSRPEQVIGMHYFSPVDKMPLLEIIVTDKTADQVTATCVDLGKKQGKTVIVVRDGVGFYTSRILGPYMNEAAQLLAEGTSIEAIDAALRDWGFPVGPITLLDEVGIDVAEKVGHIMVEAFGDRMTPPPIMQKLVEDGRMGRKNRKGFYTYGTKKKQVDETVYGVLGIKPGKAADAAEIAQRCALLMINEAMLCYGEGILRSPRDGDIGAIFGLGFPPFRGGPFRYVDAVGAGTVVRTLEDYALKFGPRFRPAPVLLDMAAKGARFYPGG
jgi:3-hydroxyacyl-CoA dehydrogenase/enoyl-CoA hydratase/3-hydroxybutyryl-CoA epimerase